MPPGPNSGIKARENAVFRTTRWSMVLTAGRASHPGAVPALARLCENYWYPLYAFARRKGHSPEEAQDLTQGFFAVLLEKNYLHAVDRARGRFRSFLLTSFEHFLRNEWTKERTLKRGGGLSFVSWETGDAESRYQQEPVDGMTPEKVFEHRWAVTLLATTLERLRSEFERAGKGPEFESLEVFLSGEKHPASYAEAARKLERSEGAVRVAVHRLRARYGELLRLTIAETLTDPADVDGELRHLFAVLSE
jgi:DNA-directed RNA polymerase specialized sigma24 family protein